MDTASCAVQITPNNRVFCIGTDGTLYLSKRALADVTKDRPLTAEDYDRIGTLPRGVLGLKASGGANLEREVAGAGINSR